MKPHLTLVLVLSMAASASAQTLRSELVVGGIENPTSLCSPPGDASRLFVTSGPKGIFIIENGVLLPQRFLDLEGLLDAQQGLMSMAFHPDYATNGRFFITYMDVNQATSLVEYQVSANPNLADPASATFLLGPVPQPAIVHNWNYVRFGADGMLYLSTGDGVLSSDNVTSNSQDLGSLFGKLLRLDVDLPAPYIPADNPFVGLPGVREEVFAYGLRQPWRYCMDDASGLTYIADVGDGTNEEINVLPTIDLKGANFGWRCMAGTACENFGGCNPMCNDPSWVEPVYEYDHTQGRCALIGGSVYRGTEIPNLQGTYFFADWCAASFYSFRYDGGMLTEFADRSLELAGPGTSLELPNSFGTDADGNLYILDKFDGQVFRIEEDCPAESVCVTTPNSAGPGAVLSTRGTTRISNADFELLAGGCPANKLGIFFYGFGEVNLPFGNGTRCASSPIYRLVPAVTTDAFGRASFLVDFQVPPASLPPGDLYPGRTAVFQFWFRDPTAGGATYDASDAVRVTFCP